MNGKRLLWRKKTRELIVSNRIPKETWVNYMKELYKKQLIEIELNIPEIMIIDNIIVERKDVNLAQKKIKKLKKRGT